VNSDSRAKKLIHLCQKYQEYLQSGASVNNGIVLSEALNDYGLEMHGAALSLYVRGGDGASGFRLNGSWSSSTCYLTQYPPKDAEPQDIWFDPYELSFMVKTVNPLGYGKAVIGWVSISPVFYWQYNVFQQLVKFRIRDNSFLHVDDLLASRPFGIDKWDYVSDVYHEEAAAYAFWHGKWISSNIRAEALTEQLTVKQLEAIFPEGMNYWDASFSGDEGSRGVFNCTEDKIINKYSINEWSRSDEIGFMTVITDQVGLISSEILPRESGECVTLLNCSRKI